jgi:hypothetical protein
MVIVPVINGRNDSSVFSSNHNMSVFVMGLLMLYHLAKFGNGAFVIGANNQLMFFQTVLVKTVQEVQLVSLILS